MNLLGVALTCSIAAEFALSLDVAMLKQEVLPDPFLNYSSAAVAAFATRALFFVVRDIITILGLTKHTLGIVLLFLGAEFLVGRALYISALFSCAGIACITAFAAAVSCLHTRQVPKQLQ